MSTQNEMSVECPFLGKDLILVEADGKITVNTPEIKKVMEELTSLKAENERLKKDKEIAFNIGVEQSNEIVELHAVIKGLREACQMMVDWEETRNPDKQIQQVYLACKEALNSPTLTKLMEVEKVKKFDEIKSGKNFHSILKTMEEFIALKDKVLNSPTIQKLTGGK